MIKSLAQLTNYSFKQKRVLVRVDLNVPIEGGKVSDPFRIEAVKKTVDFLIEREAKVYLLSHFGRPLPDNNPSHWDPDFSLIKIASCVEEVMSRPLRFIPAYAGAKVQKTFSPTFSSPESCPLFLLENIRFDPREEKNSPLLAAELAQGMDLYVNEAFSCSHRAHASVEAITHILPSVAGFHFANEVSSLTQYLDDPKRPLAAVVGGSKVSTKLHLLKALSQKVDLLVIGGAMANTFLKAKGIEIGSSLYEQDFILQATDILNIAKAKIILPADAIVASTLEDTATPQSFPINIIPPSQKIFDIGLLTLKQIEADLKNMKTIIWNGPLGVFENPDFAKGTVALAHILSTLSVKGAVTVAGGGDTLAALNQAKITYPLTYLSTAGGAFLEWLEGKELPGVKSLNSSIFLNK